MENIEEIEADLKSLVIDSSFDPTDDRLITQYLRKKIANQYVPPCFITDVNLYHHHPKDLPGSGYWKATGADKSVNNVNDETVGFKQELVFFDGEGEITSWIMHEYKDLENSQKSNDMMLDDWVLCRIYYDKVREEELKVLEEWVYNLFNEPSQEICIGI